MTYKLLPQTSPFFAASYSEAQRLMRANPRVTVQWDGGQGWVCEGCYDPRLKRVVSRTFNPTTGGFCD